MLTLVNERDVAPARERSASMVTLTTDFGTGSSYVGVMKGVIGATCPGARVVDLTHEVTPHNVLEAASILSHSYKYFPPWTVHVVVVDPGVGSERAPLACQADGHMFVAPDNGVLTGVLCADRVAIVHRVTATKLTPWPISGTFHGRDIFAPTAARLARGETLESLGARVEQWARLDGLFPRRDGEELCGAIVHIDRFGNLVTNLSRREVERLVRELGPAPGDGQRSAVVTVAGHSVTEWVSHYEEAPSGVPFAVWGSWETIEISLREVSAKEVLGGEIGQAIRLSYPA